MTLLHPYQSHLLPADTNFCVRDRVPDVIIGAKFNSVGLRVTEPKVVENGHYIGLH